MDKPQQQIRRTERDTLGFKDLPADAYYGIQTFRAAENFDISGLQTHPEHIRSLVQIKQAAAMVHAQTGRLNQPLAAAIISACDEILSGKWHEQFIVDPIQGGAGTSLNMNANEVIANRANELLGGSLGDYTPVSPNDHVNCGQSTNDVFPSSGRMAALRLLKAATRELVRLRQALAGQAKAFDAVVKLGRTQLQDAVPIRLGQVFQAYASAIQRDLERFERAKHEMRTLNLGGTVIGTGLNADTVYQQTVVQTLSRISGLELVQAGDLIDATQNADAYSVVSGCLKSCAVNLSKLSNDLRLMASGPRAGLGEINLPTKQNGSSIIPGKVNPVIPELVNQVAFDVIGKDLTITLAAQAGQLELNAFEPILFVTLFESIDRLTRAVRALVDHCIPGITANAAHCRQQVENSLGLVTAISPSIGYDKAADLAEKALRSGLSLRSLLVREQVLSQAALDQLLDVHAMTKAGGAEPH